MSVNVGDQIVVPPDEGEHSGHTLTVRKVVHYRTGLPEDAAEPDVVHVRCSCGSEWSYEDLS